jgi:hypothetical protein
LRGGVSGEDESCNQKLYPDDVRLPERQRHKSSLSRKPRSAIEREAEERLRDSPTPTTCTVIPWWISTPPTLMASSLDLFRVATRRTEQECDEQECRDCEEVGYRCMAVILAQDTGDGPRYERIRNEDARDAYESYRAQVAEESCERCGEGRTISNRPRFPHDVRTVRLTTPEK